MMCPPLMHNSKLTLFMTEGVTDVQMFLSLICLLHVKLEWEVPVSTPVSEAQWIFKTHSQPFILCCWNNNVSRDPHIRAPSERICVLHLHDLPHFGIWDGRLHHLTSSKQLTGFIIWLARRCCHRVQQWHEPAIWNGIFSSDGMSWWSVLQVEDRERHNPSLTLPIFSQPVWGVKQTTLESPHRFSYLQAAISQLQRIVYSWYHTPARGIKILPVEILSRVHAPS